MPPDIRTGHVVAGFRIGDLVGSGAMGAVYLAADTATGERIALKLLAPDLVDDERFRRRFLRETELARSLDHPNVVPVLAAGEEEGTLYLAMPYIESEDLRKVLRREGTLDAGRALRIAGQVAAALDAAHRAGLVHRDVKPGNVLVGADDHVFVCDFGLARHLSSVSSLTSDRGFVGTIDYVSPEQIEGGPIDGRADVYSLACLLFECLAGAPPFERESELSVVFAHLNDPPPPVTDYRPDLPAALDAVFATALAKSPRDRYGTCGDLVAAAEAALEGKVIRPRRRRTAALALAAAALAALAAVIVVAAAFESGGRGHAALSLSPSALNLVNARTGQVAARIPLGAKLPVADTGLDVAFTPHAAWALVWTAQELVRVDRTTHRRAVVHLPWHPGRITAAGNSVWVTQDFGPAVWQIDARTARVSRKLALRSFQNEGGIAYGAGSLWLGAGPGVIRVDPSTGRLEHVFRLPGISSGTHVVFADGLVWAARPGNGLVAKIEPGTDRVAAQVPLHGSLTDLAVGGGRVWVSIVPENRIYELSQDNLSVQAVHRAGNDPERLSFGGGKLWTADPGATSIASLDRVSGAAKTFPADAEPATAAYRAGMVWVGASPALPTLPPISGQELRIAGSGTAWDPLGGGFFYEQELYATCARLLDYADAPGPAGTRLEPEIAAAMPTVSNGGRSYEFRIRSGFRFSPPSNEPVSAATFKHTVERELANADGETYASDIVGAAAYQAGKAAHVAGIVARGDRLAITLVRPDGGFLQRLALPRFCPVPLSTPTHREITHPLPSAGPYYVSASEGGRTVLLRNPNYHGARPRRPARVVYDENAAEQQSVLRADRGLVDLLPASINGPLIEPGGVIERRAGRSPALARRYHVYGVPIVDALVFNTRRPLFRGVRLRQAVNEAIDRTELAAAFGDVPADRLVPPAVTGYPAGRVYPLRPNAVAARRLAGLRNRHGVLYICGDPRERTLARILQRDLAAIRLSFDVVDDESNCSAAESRRADVAIVSGFPFLQSEDRDPEAMLDQVLGQGAFGEPLSWQDAGFRRRLTHARLLTGGARAAAYRRLVDDFTRAAPIAVFGSWAYAEYYSAKVGCKVFQGYYGFVDLGALCRT
ncbi:MAG TPA: protein kinase [Gaiellaceae bacterium]|nr:protein kinase [Gaiellaceae bacterium]